MVDPKKLIREKIDALLLDFNVEVSYSISHAQNPNFGDYSSNVALILFNYVKEKYKNPIVLAEDIVSKLDASELFSDAKVEKGFINFWLKKEYLIDKLKEISEKKKDFGSSSLGKGKKIQVEFISANPTGPLTLGNGRGGFTGDVIANVLEKSGFEVEREYYVNDMGVQVAWVLGASMREALGLAVPKKEDMKLYKGEYVKDLAERLKGYKDFPDNWTPAGEEAARIILDEMIKKTISKMQINHGKGFDEFFLESSLYEDKSLVGKVLAELKNKDLIFEDDGATFFKTTKYGDDKDRVIRKSDGIATYFFSDIIHKSYIMGKKFDRLVMLLGADHHGYQARLQAAMSSFDYGDKLSIIIIQLVRLISGGKEVRMSKRAGTYVTLDELIDEVGLDSARFYFVSKAPNSHLDFDLDLAKKKDKDNPVYYVQYAHARISSILAKDEAKIAGEAKFDLLEKEEELALIRHLIKLPELVEDLVGNFEVHRLTAFAITTADLFHKFYEKHKVLSNDQEMTKARLGLILATQIVLQNTLSLLGISAPEKM